MQFFYLMDQQGGQTIDKNWNMCDMALNFGHYIKKSFVANMYNLSRYVFKFLFIF